MSRRGSRHIWSAIGLIAIVAIAVFAVLPSVVSKELIRQRLTQEISAWSGYEVEALHSPQLSFFPVFRAVLTDIIINDTTATGPKPVMTAERVEVNLSLISLLTGNVSFADTRIIRPRFLVDETVTDPANFGPALMANSGRFGLLVRATRRAIDEKPSAPDLSSVRSMPFGTMTLEDGMVVFTNENGAQREAAAKINGTLNWQNTSMPASFRGRATVHGEAVEFDTTADQLLLLLAGGTSSLRVNVASTPLNLNYNGNANLSENLFMQGEISVKSPSIKQTLEWMQSTIQSSAATGSFSLEANATATRKRIKLDNLAVALNDNPAKGTLEIGFEKEMPSIAGTLAFTSLDLHSFLDAFMPLPHANNTASEVDTRFLKQIDLDLRLSAQNATAGSFTLTNVGATAQVKGGRADFNIGDATAFNGTVEAGFNLVQTEADTVGELRLVGRDIDSAALTSALGFGNRFTLGKGTAALTLKGPVQDWSSLFSASKGTFSMRFGPGQVASFDVGDFISKASTDRFFGLNSKTDASLAFNTLEVKAGIVDGIATLETVKMDTKQGNVTLTGIIPLVGQSLALTGDLLLAKPNGEADATPERHVRFFVGGSWDQPFISPIFSEQPAAAD